MVMLLGLLNIRAHLKKTLFEMGLLYKIIDVWAKIMIMSRRKYSFPCMEIYLSCIKMYFSCMVMSYFLALK